MVKKRKTEMDLAEDSTFFQSFVGAANAVSHMYTLALKEQRAASQAATRQTLERIAQWADMPGTAETIPWALRKLLHEEHLKAGGGGLYARPQGGHQQQNMQEVVAETPAVPHFPPGQWHNPHEQHTPTPLHGNLLSENFQQQNYPKSFSLPQFGIPHHQYDPNHPPGPGQGSNNGV
ncbi:hypothetical protein BSKO_02972 [Bryopsis sp. KO-2023]|nr:hypothetical protein BSKO_02972 [Bryopsis sp. KO-2023]